MKRLLVLFIVFASAWNSCICASESSDFVDNLECSLDTLASIILPDSINTVEGTYIESDWRYHLRNKTLSVNDTSIRWPRFINFCLNVYRWADHVFNYHDSLYVKGTGKYGKALILCDNWADSYSFQLEQIPSMIMMGPLYTNLGIQLKYSILSIGYSVDMNSIFSHNPSKHKKWNFSISCARFLLEANLWQNEGGTYVRRFGDYNEGKLVRLPFDGLVFNAYNIHAIYFFNFKRFSLGATHNYSNDQIKSAGSFTLGADISSYRVDFDFTLLPSDLKDFYPYPIDLYRFRYNTYALIIGYTYNWVINKHFVANISLFPSLGITRTHKESTDGRADLFALNGKVMAALLYDHKAFFTGLKVNLKGNFFHSNNIKFWNLIQNYQLAVGVRF